VGRWVCLVGVAVATSDRADASSSVSGTSASKLEFRRTLIFEKFKVLLKRRHNESEETLVVNFRLWDIARIKSKAGGGIVFRILKPFLQFYLHSMTM